MSCCSTAEYTRMGNAIKTDSLALSSVSDGGGDGDELKLVSVRHKPNPSPQKTAVSHVSQSQLRCPSSDRLWFFACRTCTPNQPIRVLLSVHRPLLVRDGGTDET